MSLVVVGRLLLAVCGGFCEESGAGAEEQGQTKYQTVETPLFCRLPSSAGRAALTALVFVECFPLLNSSRRVLALLKLSVIAGSAPLAQPLCRVMKKEN